MSYDCHDLHMKIVKLEEKNKKLEQQNKYLTEQNKAFQEQYNESGTIIRNLRQQNKELIEFTKNMRDIGKLNPERLPAYTDIIYHDANDLIIKITGENNE